MSDFEEFWGDRGDKWNGKLDIKEFAREIWKAREEAMSEACKRLEAMEGGDVAWHKSSKIRSYKLKEIIDIKDLLTDVLYTDEWTIEQPKPKRIPEIQKFANWSSKSLRWNGQKEKWEVNISIRSNIFVWELLPDFLQNLFPKWEGIVVDSLHTPEGDE